MWVPSEKFVAVGSTSLGHSVDGIAWTIRWESGGSRVAYGNGIFVLISSGVIRYSTNGIDWTAVSVPGSWRSITYGNDKFVIISSSIVGYSTDGINWTTVNLNLNDITYGKGMFVAVGASAPLRNAYSTDRLN